MIEPLVSRYVLGGGHGTAVVRSASLTCERSSVNVPGHGTALVSSYDGTGRLVSRSSTTSVTVTVTVRAGGFTIARR